MLKFIRRLYYHVVKIAVYLLLTCKKIFLEYNVNERRPVFYPSLNDDE